MIEFKNVCVSFDQTKVLHDVSFAVNRGEIVTLVGPNGSGKSTILKSIVGAVSPTSGAIIKQPDLKIGYVPQKLSIDPSLPLTVTRFLNLPRRRSTGRVEVALKTAGVEGLAHRQMATLSGGQFQRVLLARAVLDKPDILLLDEATQGLDQPGSAAFYQQIETVRSTMDCAVLMVSHELHVVMATSERVICLNGHICCEGHPQVVASAPEYRALFGSGTQGTLALYRHDHNHSHDTCNDPSHHHPIEPHSHP